MRLLDIHVKISFRFIRIVNINHTVGEMSSDFDKNIKKFCKISIWAKNQHLHLGLARTQVLIYFKLDRRFGDGF